MSNGINKDDEQKKKKEGKEGERGGDSCLDRRKCHPIRVSPCITTGTRNTGKKNKIQSNFLLISINRKENN